MILKHAQQNNKIQIIFKITNIIFNIDENTFAKKNSFNKINKIRNENVRIFDSNKFNSQTKNLLKIAINDENYELFALNTISLNANNVIIHQSTNKNKKKLKMKKINLNH